MHSRTRPAVLFSSLSALILLAACGGGGSSSPTSPVTTTPPVAATPTPSATATPTPSGTPWDCNRSALPAGPVVTFRFKLKAIRRDGNFIEGPPEGPDFQRDSQGRIIVRVGDFLTFDSTQKNGSNNICQWNSDPRWSVSDRSVFSERTDASRQTTACGFLLRGDVVRTGELEVDASLDGIEGETVYERADTVRLIAR